MFSIARATAATALVASMVACASGGVGPGDDPYANGTDGPAVVEITNHNWSDMAVYAIRLGTQVRIGTVTSMTTERLELPRGFLGSGSEFRLMVDPIGGFESYRTPPIRVWPGDRVFFTVRNHLAISSYRIAAR